MSNNAIYKGRINQVNIVETLEVGMHKNAWSPYHLDVSVNGNSHNPWVEGYIPEHMHQISDQFEDYTMDDVKSAEEDSSQHH
mmetsp:Transcript_36846/g.110464  ORF Transcript_36846/g.110464 Transcript_36846/m.110464 type:complete len:82 (+) Transcript_36846:908-1153(+)